MAKKVKIKSINIEIGGTTISLSPEEARELHAALGEMVKGGKTEKHYFHYTPPRYWRWEHPLVYGTSSCSISSAATSADSVTLSLLSDTSSAAL